MLRFLTSTYPLLQNLISKSGTFIFETPSIMTNITLRSCSEHVVSVPCVTSFNQETKLERKLTLKNQNPNAFFSFLFFLFGFLACLYTTEAPWA